MEDRASAHHRFGPQEQSFDVEEIAVAQNSLERCDLGIGAQNEDAVEASFFSDSCYIQNLIRRTASPAASRTNKRVLAIPYPCHMPVSLGVEANTHTRDPGGIVTVFPEPSDAAHGRKAHPVTPSCDPDSDVVSYSRLMEQDEAGTLALLKSRRRSLLEPLGAQHQGRVFKFTSFVRRGGLAQRIFPCSKERQNWLAGSYLPDAAWHTPPTESLPRLHQPP